MSIIIATRCYTQLVAHTSLPIGLHSRHSVLCYTAGEAGDWFIQQAVDAAAESSESDGGGGGGGGEVDVKRMKLDVDAAADVSGGAVAEAAAGYAGQSHVTLLCLNAPVAKQEPDAELDDSASYSHCTPLLLYVIQIMYLYHITAVSS